MRLFPIREPRIGISLHERAAGLVAMRRSWRWPARRTRVRRLVERALPPGLIRCSWTEANVTDPDALAAHLRDLLREELRGDLTPIALTLPDLSFRIALFDFEQWPQRPAECEALVRWRFQKDARVPAGQGRVAYRAFHMTSELGGTPGSSATIRVLALFIGEAVVSQYEQVCEVAGLIPVTVGAAGLRLFDLCRPAMRPFGGDMNEGLFVHVDATAFCFLAYRHGAPVFLRVKRLGTASLSDELLATLQFYRAGYGRSIRADRRGMEDATPLFIVDGAIGWSREPAPLSQDDTQWERLCPVTSEDAAGLGIRVVPMSGDVLGLLDIQPASPVSRAVPPSELAALAGVWANV